MNSIWERPFRAPAKLSGLFSSFIQFKNGQFQYFDKLSLEHVEEDGYTQLKVDLFVKGDDTVVAPGLPITGNARLSLQTLTLIAIARSNLVRKRRPQPDYANASLEQANPASNTLKTSMLNIALTDRVLILAKQTNISTPLIATQSF